MPLSFLINWLYTLFSGIVCLILIFRCDFLCYAIKFIVILLFLELFLRFLIHILTSKVVFVIHDKLYEIFINVENINKTLTFRCYNRRKLSSLRRKKYFVILVVIAKDYSF